MFTVPVYQKRVVLFHLWEFLTCFFIQVESALYSKIKASGVNLIKRNLSTTFTSVFWVSVKRGVGGQGQGQGRGLGLGLETLTLTPAPTPRFTDTQNTLVKVVRRLRLHDSTRRNCDLLKNLTKTSLPSLRASSPGRSGGGVRKGRRACNDVSGIPVDCAVRFHQSARSGNERECKQTLKNT